MKTFLKTKTLISIALLGSPFILLSKTIGFWQFEGDQFLKDSTGNNDLQKVGSATQIHEKIAYFDGEGVLTTDTNLMEKPINFTIEGYFSNYNEESKRQILAGEYFSFDRGWEIFIEKDGKLVMELATGAKTGKYYVSDLYAKPQTSYYFAAVVRRHGLGAKKSKITFYLKELDGGTMQTSAVMQEKQWAHYMTKRAKFVIGGRVNKHLIHFVGAIDDIRLTQGLLDEKDLLINSQKDESL